MGHFDVPFHDKNSERYFLSRRVERILEELEGKRLYTDSESVNGFRFRDGQYTIDQLNEGDWRDFDSENEYWGYPECYAWFRHTFTVPARFAGKPVLYEIVPFPGAGWQGTNPQLIIFSGGKILQGMDSNHTSVKLLDCAKGGETFDIAINAHTDAFAWRGRVQMQAKLRVIDEQVLRLIFDLKTPLEVSRLYEVDDLPRVDIIKVLDKAVNVLDFNTRDGAAFAASCETALAILETELYGKDDAEVTAHCVGHTHIDVAWLWRLRQTRDKTGRSFATVLKMMEEFPEYKFMSPQAQLYDYVKQDYPEVYEGIKQRIQDGRWEAEGSMWVEADTNVTSGESLVRQFLFGKRFFKQEFGVETKNMWLPDVFGYSAALPQIMKRAGIDFFMTTKISWNEYNKVPYDTFNWKGIDGTSILSHFIPATSNRDEGDSFQTTYNAFLNPAQVSGGWKRYSQKDLNRDILISYGHGDGGGGPTKEMLEYGRRMERGIPGCPRVKQSFSAEYFDLLNEQVKDDFRLPEWVGELYLEFHRGTLTAQARNKRYNRKSELLYHDLETVSALAQKLQGAAYPTEHINEGWKIILLNQFHDIIPGSSIKEVYDDSKLQYDALISQGNALLTDTMNGIAANIKLDSDALVVFNTFGAARSDVVITDFPAKGDFAILDADGAALPWQKTYDGKLAFLAKDVPAKGYKTFRLAAGSSVGEALEVSASHAETDFFTVDFDQNMNISKLYHKQSKRCVAPEGEVLGKLLAYQDKPYHHDAWDIKVYYDRKVEEILDVSEAAVVENGPVRAVVKIVRRFYDSTINQFYIFYKTLDRIDVDYVADWKECDILLKADYPVDVNAMKATFDIQFGSYERSTHNNTLWDYAQFEVCGHKWADLSDNSFGLSVLNDCKYGNTVKKGRIQPTLLRCATQPNWAQDREVHYFTYSLYPHAGNVSASDVVAHGYSLNLPLYCAAASANAGNLAGEYGLVSCCAPNVVIETVKKAEDSEDIILRAYESGNKGTVCCYAFTDAPKRVVECNLMEEDEDEIAVDGKTIALKFRPFEIKTLKVTF